MFPISRRQLLQSVSCGFGYMAFAGLAHEARAKEEFDNPLAAKAPQFAAKAKRIILLCMQGGPSHVDLFDDRPELTKHSGKSPGDVGSGLNAQKGRKLLGSPFKFSPQGKSGLMMSELCRTWLSMPTICASSTVPSPMCPITRKPSSKCIRATFSLSDRRWARGCCMDWAPRIKRSEEHTSELQSQ